MMKGFEDVTLAWRDEVYTIPAKRQMMLIAELEDILQKRDGTPAVAVLLSNPGWAKLAMAFGAALRYAGAKVSDDEIYLSITQNIADGDFSEMMRMREATLGLLSIMAPPIASSFTKEDDAGK
jgi:hypothetical protein